MNDYTGETRSFGALLSNLRRQRDMSQLTLALDANVSARHVSFLESGRSTPSRAMVTRLARALGAAPDATNQLLLAAGYAPVATAANAPALDGVQTSADGLAALLRNAIALALDLQPLGVEDAVARVRPALADLGLGWFHTGVVTRAASPASGPPTIMLHTQGFPHVAWLAHNVDYGYRAHDPLVRATLDRHRAFFWEDVLGDRRRLAREERGIFDEAGDFGVQSGFVMPIHRADGSVLAMSCMAEDREATNPATRLAAQVICTALLEKFEDASAQGATLVERPALKPEARDLLRWVLAGRDLAWISGRLGAPEETVRAAASEACASVGVTDLLQGALRANRYRLLEAA